MLKTLRNNLMSCNRHLWNKSDLSWEPIKQLIMEDLSILPRRFPRLTKSHAYPENYEKMKVYLAAQVNCYHFNAVQEKCSIINLLIL